jgi:glucosamine kinase
MDDSNSYDVIGVDGGGTSCRIALCLRGQRTELTIGQANVTTDFERAVRTISQGLQGLAEKSGVSVDKLTGLPAYLGLAGVMSDQMGTRVANALPLSRVRVQDDRISALTGALGNTDGVIAGIGTGSFLARQSGGNIKLIGGYGFRIGDDASGAYLGRALLIRCLHVLDGITPASALTDAVLNDFGHQAERFVEFASHATPGDFGAFAPQIFAAAQTGDVSGLALIQKGADYITAATKALGWRSGDALCLIGGVGPHYAPFLPTDIAAALVKPKGTGLDGALLLAQRMANETAEGAK